MTALKRFILLDRTLGSVALAALALQYLALSDITKQGADSALEWRVVGVSMIILAVFTVSTFIVLAQVLRNWKQTTTSD